ncbi:MAG: tetratricopeptide repeat-containing serine protease family protein [Verrucomicrobiota bacterium]
MNRFITLLGLLLALLGGRGLAANFDADDFKAARKEAEQGDVNAALALGMMYYAGEGTPQNYEEAVRWYRRAAEQGNPVAQNNLGLMYLNGQGAAVNLAEAVRMLRAAAEKGYPKAQMNLGQLYADGRGVPRNYRDAAYWLQRASALDDADAQLALGQAYGEGKIVPQDRVLAYQWFLLAAAKGNGEAAYERDTLRPLLNPAQIAQAQKLAAAFVPQRAAGQAGKPQATGTGFIVTTNGFVLTAYHVVEDSTNLVVVTRKVRFAAQLAKADKTNDIALLQIVGAFPPTPTNGMRSAPGSPRLMRVASNFRPLPLIAEGNVKVGAPVSTIGFPNVQIQGREPKFTRGEINSLAGIKDDASYFQVSTPVQPGNSGGPLLNSSGQVVGMVLARLSDITLLKTTGTVPQNVNYALKSSRLAGLVNAFPAAKNAFVAAVEKAAPFADSNWLGAANESVVLIEVY